MAIWRVNNSTLLGGEVCAQWQPNHAYSLGARCVCRTSYGTVARRAYVYECTTAGTSHATTEPTWPTSGTVADGADTLVWTCRSSNDGNWDNASCILHYVLNHAAIAAGDLVCVDDGHSEAVMIGASSSYLVKGSATKNNPIRILCVDKTDDSLSVGAVVEDAQTNVSYTMRFSGNGYSYGVQYKSGSHIIASHAGGIWTFETSPGNKVFSLAASRYLSASGSYPGQVFIKGDIEFLAANAFILSGVPFIWDGGAVIASLGVTILLSAPILYGSGKIEISNVDLSAMGNNTLMSFTNSLPSNILFSRCKIPAAFTAFSGAAPGYDTTKIRLHHCSSDNATYDFYEESYCGSVRDETTRVRTGGASDGTTSISIKMASSANTKESVGYLALSSPPVASWTNSTTSKTFTVEVLFDSATNLQDDEIWLELEYPADASSGLGAIASSQCAQLGTPTDIPDSAETWTTTGMTNPNTRKLSVTCTPGKAGPITARVYLAKASTTVYVDPIITES